MQEHNYTQVAQEYYRQRHTTPGWQSLVQVLFSGILASADDEDGRRFIMLMGNNLARQHQLPASATLGELEDNINHILSRFDWGVVKLEATQQQLALVHIAWPVSPQGQVADLWRIVLFSQFEGLYGGWLLIQGGRPFVQLRWQEHPPEGRSEERRDR